MIFIVVDRNSKLNSLGVQISPNYAKFEIVHEFDEIENPTGLACLANQFAALELFGASKERPIRYLGERYDYYEFGIRLPDINMEIAEIDDRLQDIFHKILIMISDYNKEREKKINGVIYDIEEFFIPEEYFLKNINNIIKIFQDSKL